MNQTQKNLHYRLLRDGYRPDEIAFHLLTSPKFTTADGIGWEAKVCRSGTITFYSTQLYGIRQHGNVRVVLFNGSQTEVIKFSDLSIPGYHNQYKIVLVKVPDVTVKYLTERPA